MSRQGLWIQAVQLAIPGWVSSAVVQLLWQPSSRIHCRWCGVNSTVPEVPQLDEPPCAVTA